MISSRRVEDSVSFPFRAVLFQYRQKPKEWHVCCVENGAFGWGNTPDEAMHELALTLKGQIDETFKTGTDFFFAEPDEEWVRAFEAKIPPAEGVRLVGRFNGHLEIQ